MKGKEVTQALDNVEEELGLDFQSCVDDVSMLQNFKHW
jgi:hypothetical protein